MKSSNLPSPYELAKECYRHRPPLRAAEVLQKLGYVCDDNLWTSRVKEASERIKAYDTRGLIRHEVLRENEDYLPREPELENRLREKYPLQGVIVVNVSSLGKVSDELDDRIHKALGAWAGRLVSSLVRPEDVIGTGGGRGPYFTAKHCFAWDSDRNRSLRVIALSGLIGSGMWATTVPSPQDLDADSVAGFLHQNLGGDGQVQTVGRILGECRLPKTGAVTVAVIGVGALGGGHRLKRTELNQLRPVRQTLEQLNLKAEMIERRFEGSSNNIYHPVGDICNSYFIVPPNPDGRIPKVLRKDFDALKGYINELNRKFCTTKPDQLAEICGRGATIAVVGGRHKIAATAYALDSKLHKRWITHLVTDQNMCECLLKGSALPSLKKA